jgi:hypothetical protein
LYNFLTFEDEIRQLYENENEYVSLFLTICARKIIEVTKKIPVQGCSCHGAACPKIMFNYTSTIYKMQTKTLKRIFFKIITYFMLLHIWILQ